MMRNPVIIKNSITIQWYKYTTSIPISSVRSWDSQQMFWMKNWFLNLTLFRLTPYERVRLDGHRSSTELRLMGILQKKISSGVQEWNEEIGSFDICGNEQDLLIFLAVPVNIETDLTRPAKFIHSLKLIQLPQDSRSYLSKLETRANVLPLIYQDEICLIFNNLTSESLELENACLQASVHRLPETWDCDVKSDVQRSTQTMEGRG